MDVPRRQSSRIKSQAVAAVKRSAESEDKATNREGSRPKKRAKTASGKATKLKTSQGKLSMICSMPLDILFEIFGSLTPQDLVSLTRANKALRDTLLTTDAIMVWKASRESVDAPEPSPDFTEPKWCKLLFGGSFCEICGCNTGCRGVDFSIRRRLCRWCSRQSLTVRDEKTVDPQVWDLVNFTWSRGARLYQKDEVQEVDLELRLRQGTDKMSYIQEREAFVQFVVKHSALCKTWQAVCAKQKSIRERLILKKRIKIVKQKLLALGYSPLDVEVAKNAPGVYTYTELTDRAWKQLWPRVEKHMLSVSAKNLRDKLEFIESSLKLEP